MRVIIKSLLWLLLSLLVLLGLAVLAFPWWGPPAFKQGAEHVLRRSGLSEAKLSLEEMGFSQLRLSLERLRYQVVTVSGTGLKLGYDWQGLRKRELERVTVAHPLVAIDLSADWPVTDGSAGGDAPSLSDKLPGRFPVKNVNIDDAELTLQGSDWVRTLGIDLQLTGQEEIKGEVSLQGEGVQVDAQADVVWGERSGRVSATAKVDALAEWLEFGRNRGWFTLPAGFAMTSGTFEFDAGAGFGDESLHDWNLDLLGREVAATLEPSGISLEQVELKMKGEGAKVGQLDMKGSTGTVQHGDLNLSFEQLLASASDAEQIGIHLKGWALNGESDVDGLGSISASAGDVELFVAGGWQSWRPDFEVAKLGLQMGVAQAPLSLYTGLGSASGSWQMNAELSADGDARKLSLSTELLNGSLTAAAAGLASERLSVTVNGTLPDSLGAVVEVRAGEVTWSDGGGRLSGLKGGFELTSLLPPASKGRQTLAFASIKQGEFAAGSGQLRVSYASDRAEAPPLDMEITTTALGGDIRILVAGRLREPLSLSVRLFLDSVQLREIADLFPQFEGRIEGIASGELALRLEGAQIVLRPGELKLAADTSGRFEYLRQGWLTQDPELDPESFISGRDIVEIMQDPQGATALTELAMRDLKMSEFRLEVQETETGEQSVVAEIKGNRTIKGVTVPVVLDVPIRGDVKETINAVFEFNARM